MGYTHYWYRKDKEIEQAVFNGIASDFKKLSPVFEKLGITLAGGNGAGEPVIDGNRICFNGLRKCGHPVSYELGIAWPSQNAGGVANPWREDVQNGSWFAGATIEKRTCSGDCSHETCWFPRIVPTDQCNRFDSHPSKEKGDGWHFNFCKTAYKPYDLAVTAFLVIAKHHLNEKLWVQSDGETQHWADARILCERMLGYGIGFELDR
jgi:hypothetical protein